MTTEPRVDALRILIVDDDPAIRALLGTLFRREGWAVATAADGDAAVEQITLANPDVVILDLMLPKKRGVEVLQHPMLRTYPSDQRVIVLTAISEAQLRRLAGNLRVREVIRKPFDNRQLIASVRACVTLSAREQPLPRGRS